MPFSLWNICSVHFKMQNRYFQGRRYDFLRRKQFLYQQLIPAATPESHFYLFAKHSLSPVLLKSLSCFNVIKDWKNHEVQWPKLAETVASEHADLQMQDQTSDMPR